MKSKDDYLYPRTLSKVKSLIAVEEEVVKRSGNYLFTTSPVVYKDTLNIPDELLDQLADYVPTGYCIVIAHGDVSRKF
jgi:hypothetical protein